MYKETSSYKADQIQDPFLYS